MRPTDVCELNIGGVSAAYIRQVKAICPDQLPLATRVLARLEPRQWMLEWYVPWWLGHAFGMERARSEEIVLSNLLGLASLRLRDDLADGEVATQEICGAEALSAALYDQAVAVYRRLFDASSPFWEGLTRYMSEWRQATHEGNRSSFSDVGAVEGTHVPLARRGAPLKTAALAMCLLADRADRFAELELCLDHVLTAMVLYDHVCDWEDDLTAGRWNAFIARLSGLPQVALHRDRNRSCVLVALMTGDAADSYLADIQQELAAAITVAETLPLAPLVEHLRGYAVRTGTQLVTFQSHYGDLARQASHVLFGTQPLVPRQGASP